MAIQSGTHLGPYEIVSAIGAGGMVRQAQLNSRKEQQHGRAGRG